MIIHTSFEDFLLFLYVHISHADNTYDPKEMDVIQEKMKDIYPEKMDFDKKLYQTLRDYNTFDKVKLPELFADTLQYFGKDRDKEKILADLSDIIEADGMVQDSEITALTALKQTINLHL